MKKIPTMYGRDESQRGHPVVDGVKPECAWVSAGEGFATVKFDGTNVQIENGRLLKRQKPKEGDYDEAAYAPADPENPSDRWIFEALGAHLKAKGTAEDGIYEAIGPKIQGNPHELDRHILIRVDPPDMSILTPFPEPPRTFERLKEYLSLCAYEGIVFHHADGLKAKIKRRDFGLPWPLDLHARRAAKKPEGKKYHFALDLDGTLLSYDGFKGTDQFGEPIVDADRGIDSLFFVKELLKLGHEVTIFTARQDLPAVREALDRLGFPKLDVTNTKKQEFSLILDDRAWRFTGPEDYADVLNRLTEDEAGTAFSPWWRDGKESAS